MKNIDITSFKEDIYELLEQVTKYDKRINISTKNGNVIVLSEKNYNELIKMINR